MKQDTYFTPQKESYSKDEHPYPKSSHVDFKDDWDWDDDDDDDDDD